MSLRRGILGLLLALVLALPAHAADKVRVRAAEHDAEGFGRIAFDWPAPVTFDARIEGKTLTVHFARPLDAGLDAVASHLDAYVASISSWFMALDGSCGPCMRRLSSSGSGSGTAGGGAGGAAAAATSKAPSSATMRSSMNLSVFTTLVMRWPVISWKLQAS